MSLYTKEEGNGPYWTKEIEGMYQLIGGKEESEIAPKLSHLGLGEILFMTLITQVSTLIELDAINTARQAEKNNFKFKTVRIGSMNRLR